MKKNWDGIIPIYINNYNQLTTTKNMAEYFDNIPDTEVIIIDNKSTYPPLIEWYRICKYSVLLLGRNTGHHAPWNSGVINPKTHKNKYKSDYYVVTDADLEINDCPLDLLNVLINGKLHHNVIKSGLSIEINDLPDGCPSKKAAYSWEEQWWRNKSSPGFYDAGVDTTFALYAYNEPRPTNLSPAIRSDRPYTAKHRPWYITSENIDEEYKFIIRSYPLPGSHMDRQDWINHLRCLL